MGESCKLSLISKGLWLYFAFELEFMGRSTFLELWISGLVFLAINCGVLKYGILDNYIFKIKKH